MKFGTYNLPQNHRQVQRTKERNVIFMKKKEIGRGYFEPKSVGKKQELRVMMVSH